MTLIQGQYVTTVVLDEELDRLLQRTSQKLGISRSAFVRDVLRKVLVPKAKPRKKRSGNAPEGPGRLSGKGRPRS